MAKKTRIPELVVGKIFIDGGDKDKVYTIGSDEDGALRIGDSRSNMVATIDQKTGKIVAGSFAGDGTELQGISAEGLEELMTAKLLTLSADKLFFNYDTVKIEIYSHSHNGVTTKDIEFAKDVSKK